MTALVLGGTGEARELAGRLVAAGVPVVSSLAGAVPAPMLPDGEVRVGGFGGVAGMVEYFGAAGVDRVVDATHPFAATITAHAVLACQQAGVRFLRLSRPSWGGHPRAASWHWVGDLVAARRAAEGLGRRVFLSIGRQGLAEFGRWADRYVLVRVAAAPQAALPAAWEVLCARGPFDADAERALLRDRAIDVLVTKDSGGDRTVAKLDAAAELGVPVVIVARPPVPPGVDQVATVAGAASWVLGGS